MVKVKMFSSVSSAPEEAVDMPGSMQGRFTMSWILGEAPAFMRQTASDEVIDRVVDAAQKAPNSSNLQCWELCRWLPPNEGEVGGSLFGTTCSGHGSELFVFVARPDLWSQQCGTLEEFDRRGNMPDRAYQYFTKITRIAYTQGCLQVKRLWFPLRGLTQATPREPVGWSDMRVWAHKSTALSAGHFMLAMRAEGFDTCPMESMDSKQIKGSSTCLVWQKSMVVSQEEGQPKGCTEIFRFKRETFCHTVDSHPKHLSSNQFISAQCVYWQGLLAWPISSKYLSVASERAPEQKFV